jgi:hypothetical protein
MKGKLELDKLTHDELADKVHTVKTLMTTNAATFPAADPTTTQLGTLETSLRNAIAARLAGEETLKNLVQAEKDAAAAVAAGLTKELLYIDKVADGNPTTYTLAGVDVRKIPSATTAMPKVLDVKTSVSDFAGSLDWMCKPVPGVKAYLLQKCTGDPAVEANWSYADVSPKSSGTLHGLAAGKIWIRIIARGPGDIVGPPSDAAQDVVR